MLVNWRRARNEGARRARARGGERWMSRKRLGARECARGRRRWSREQKEDTGRPSISRPVLRSFPSAGKNPVPGWATVFVVVVVFASLVREKNLRRERNARASRLFMRRRPLALNTPSPCSRSTSIYCVYFCDYSALDFSLGEPRILINSRE